MEGNNEQIDSLLEHNTTEQMETVDWDGLNAAISRQLDQARQRKTSRIGWPTVLKIAAGLAAAAAIVLVTVTIRTKKPTAVRFENDGSTAVKFVESKGAASIQFHPIDAKSRVSVDIGGSRRKVAKCDLEIIDVKQELRKNGRPPAWIIIRTPEPALADNVTSRDEMDLVCLL